MPLFLVLGSAFGAAQKVAKEEDRCGGAANVELWMFSPVGNNANVEHSTLNFQH
jgi:hypothetical protein